jgi:AcrR family transcriptional regulator
MITEARVLTSPRKPQRANGRARYELLVAATEQLLEEHGLEALTIQRIAKAAAVPMASVYHFFPSPAAACIAVAESYLEGFARNVSEPIGRSSGADWRDVIDLLMRRTVEFYRQHPYAQRLILGSDFSWQIRQADLGNNREMAKTIALIIAEQFPQHSASAVEGSVMTAISIGDAVLALSVAEHEVITRQFADDAVLAICSYLEAKLK